MRKLSNNEKKIISLFKEIDDISKNADVKIYVFGQAGYRFHILDATNEYADFESKRECIAKERILFTSKNMLGDGGDADYYNAT